MSLAAAPRQHAHVLSDEDFQFLCRFVHEHTGIILTERKREMLYRRLMRRTRKLAITSFGEYCDILRAGEDQAELGHFINAITTNLTSFFREQHHFRYLEERYLPALLATRRDRRLRIWSAGCSSGEEPYSIAMSLRKAFGAELDGWDARILATDLDTEVLAKASLGIYEIERLEPLPYALKKQWFRKNATAAKISPALRQLITFKQLNLLAEWPMRGPFDIIFCRNVVIYFDKATQHDLIGRYYQLLKPGGLLILGHSEGLGEHAKRFENLGKTLYRKPLPAAGQPRTAP